MHYQVDAIARQDSAQFRRSPTYGGPVFTAPEFVAREAWEPEPDSLGFISLTYGLSKNASGFKHFWAEFRCRDRAPLLECLYILGRVRTSH